MRRVMAFGALLLAGALSVASVAGQQGQMNIEVEQLEDNLFILRGGGGNSAAFVTSNGVVLVDTKLAGWGQPLIDAIRSRDPRGGVPGRAGRRDWHRGTLASLRAREGL